MFNIAYMNRVIVARYMYVCVCMYVCMYVYMCVYFFCVCM